MGPSLSHFLASITWPVIVCFILGIGLLVVEMFTPGFGVPGVLGIILLIASVMFMSGSFVYSLWLALVILLIVGVLLIIFFTSAQKGRISRSPIVLNDELTTNDGYVSSEAKTSLIGKRGKALTYLRPAGSAQIDGQRLDVVADGEFIPAETDIVVERVESIRVIVKRAADVQTVDDTNS